MKRLKLPALFLCCLLQHKCQLCPPCNCSVVYLAQAARSRGAGKCKEMVLLVTFLSSKTNTVSWFRISYIHGAVDGYTISLHQQQKDKQWKSKSLGREHERKLYKYFSCDDKDPCSTSGEKVSDGMTYIALLLLQNKDGALKEISKGSLIRVVALEKIRRTFGFQLENEM